MAMGVSSGQGGVPFYDPFYMANMSRASPGIEDRSGMRGRYNDDFNVFNSVHISKPQTLSLSIPAPTTGVSAVGTAKTVDEQSVVVVGGGGGVPTPSV